MSGSINAHFPTEEDMLLCLVVMGRESRGALLEKGGMMREVSLATAFENAKQVFPK